MRLLPVSCACLLVLAVGCTRSSPTRASHSKASLVIAQSEVTPGSTVDVGIQFVTDAGWHIYWQNPGDSGEPPRLQWQLPNGITAGALEWPTPTRLDTPAGTDYGYQGNTVLLSSLQIPDTAQPGSAQVSGDLHWLACHDICVPQETHLEAPLRISSTASINDQASRVLQSAAELVPKPLGANFRAVATSLPRHFRLDLLSDEPITKAEFFPSDEEQIDNGAPQEFISHDRKVSLKFRKSEYLRAEPQHLRGVIILNARQAYQVDAPITSPATQLRSRKK